MEDNFARLEELFPQPGKILGLYMWDFGETRPMPVDLMQLQCEAGLRWLREGRLEGMAFIASCVADLGLPAVEWTKRWIEEVGDEGL